ncbi:MarR family winged helix-turn-helix transcriptional regulator [Sneathiella sp.]|uniref:MarR family winged helix-turn-helix transcriptional regulator n=1 Tax=Sneathiella sp. TaxID=1964365 RepID=UPI0035683F85
MKFEPDLTNARPSDVKKIENYRVEAQIGHLLRRAHQKASAIFQSHMGHEQITPTQFAALAKLKDEGELSQNHLGRLTAMDPATILGVIRRLRDRGLIQTRPDESDRRRTLLCLSSAGLELTNDLIPHGIELSEETLATLTPEEQEQVIELLKKIS